MDVDVCGPRTGIAASQKVSGKSPHRF